MKSNGQQFQQYQQDNNHLSSQILKSSKKDWLGTVKMRLLQIMSFNLKQHVQNNSRSIHLGA
jgi:hypothetical protein